MSAHSFVTLTSALDKIEKSSYPEHEKLKILVAEAHKMHDGIQLNVEEKIEGWRFQDGNVVRAEMQVPRLAKETADLIEEHYRHREAFENYSELVSYYKKTYEEYARNYNPLFEAMLRALDRAINKIKFQESAEAIADENKQLREEAKGVNKELAEARQARKKAEVLYAQLQEKYTLVLDNSQYYREWFTLLSDRERIGGDASARVLAAVLGTDEITIEQLAMQTKIPANLVSQYVRAFVDRGVLKRRRVGKAYKVSVNSHFIQLPEAKQEPDTDVEYAKAMVENYRQDKQETEQEDDAEPEEEETEDGEGYAILDELKEAVKKSETPSQKEQTGASTEKKIHKFLDKFKDPQMKLAAEAALLRNDQRRAAIAKMSDEELDEFAEKLLEDMEKALRPEPKKFDLEGVTAKLKKMATPEKKTEQPKEEPKKKKDRRTVIWLGEESNADTAGDKEQRG